MEVHRRGIFTKMIIRALGRETQPWNANFVGNVFNCTIDLISVLYFVCLFQPCIKTYLQCLYWCFRLTFVNIKCSPKRPAWTSCSSSQNQKSFLTFSVYEFCFYRYLSTGYSYSFVVLWELFAYFKILILVSHTSCTETILKINFIFGLLIHISVFH